MIVARRRGQPLAAFALLFGGWVIARLMLWQVPPPLGEAMAMPDLVDRAGGNAAEPREESLGIALRPRSQRAPAAPADTLEAPSPLAPSGPPASILGALVPLSADRPLARVSANRTTPVFASGNAVPATLARWSGEGWLLLRGGAAGSLAARPGSGRYGGSQAGAVLRYSLSPGEHRPALYVRTSAALMGMAERELALGGAVRPLATVPIRAQLELRAVQVGGRLRLRPAAFAVSELRPIDLPGQLRAQGYLQAGYVAGDFATPFVGGDVRIDRTLAEFGEAQLRVGGGAWGGAQKDAAALDIGPGASIETRLGGVPAKLALDYRLRVAGAAEPRSGPALTLTTGF